MNKDPCDRTSESCSTSHSGYLCFCFWTHKRKLFPYLEILRLQESSPPAWNLDLILITPPLLALGSYFGSFCRQSNTGTEKSVSLSPRISEYPRSSAKLWSVMFYLLKCVQWEHQNLHQKQHPPTNNCLPAVHSRVVCSP